MRADRRLLVRLQPVRWMFATTVAARVTETLLVIPQLMIIAAVCAAASESRRPAVPVASIAALILLVLVRSALSMLTERAGRRTATTVMSGLRLDLVRRQLSPRANPPGARPGPIDGDVAGMAACAVQGVDGLEGYFTRYLPQIALAVTVPVAVLVVCARVDLESTVIMLIVLPVVPVFTVLLGRSAAGRAQGNLAALTALSAHFLDVVRGLPTLRAFNRGTTQVPKIREVTETYRRTTMATLRLAFLSGVVGDLAATLSTALVAVSLGIRLVDGSVGLRPALTVLVLVPELYAPLRALGTHFHASADGVAATGRILDTLGPRDGRDPSPHVPSPRRHLATAAPDPAALPVVVRGMTVRFAGRPVAALDGVSLTIRPGEILAVTGASGAGKTTLGRTLLGLIRPDEGLILVGNRPLASLDAAAWRDRVAWAPQHPTLVAGSVARNIALGRAAGPLTAAERHRIEAVARQTGAHGFVSRLPHGYATLVGPGGHGLSAGERQRLGLARALIQDAGLLVLDEPTAHLDAEAARTVTEAISALRGAQTVVLLTHDLVLAACADRRVVLANGRLAAPETVAEGVS